MSYNESEKEKEFIQSGDVIRLKQFECNGYLTSSQINVDSQLPDMPDFLRSQIRRMNNGLKVERPKGGIDISEMTDAEKQEMATD